MGQVQRICVQCGYANPVESRFCARCGHDSQGQLPAPRTSLPVVISRAALPVLVGAASVAVRVGWRLLQQRLAQRARPQPLQVVPRPASPPAARTETGSVARTRRTIHIRSTWATGDANGVWRQGSSEHHIEIDE